MNQRNDSARVASASGNGQAGNESIARSASELGSITRNESGQLVVRLKCQDEPLVDARVARCFPWSKPGTYISVRNKEGKEVVLLKTLDGVDPASQEIIRQELHDKVFNPKISRVIEHKNDFGVTSIKAETDRGEVTFQIRSRDDIRTLSATRLLFRDADGNTYEIADVSTMDAVSRKFLEGYF